MNACAPPLSSAISIDTGDHLTAGSPIHGADVAEQAFESLPRRVSASVPDGHATRIGRRRNAAEQIRLEDIVARQWLACRVQHREHAVGAIDVGRRNEHHAASVEQEIGEPTALGRVEAAEHGQEMVAHLQDPLFRRRKAIGTCGHAGGAGRAHVGEEKLVLGSLSFSRGARLAPCATWIAAKQPRIGGLALARIDIAQSAEENGERGQPLKAVDDLERSARARPRPGQAGRGGRGVAVDEQHGAQEVVAVSHQPRRAQTDVVQQLTGLFRRPRKRALVGWGFNRVSLASSSPTCMSARYLAVNAMSDALRWGSLAIHSRTFFVCAIKTSHLPAAIVCAPPLRSPARLAHCALSAISQVMQKSQLDA